VRFKKGEVGMAMAMVKRYVTFLRDGKIFTTRDCLAFGKRAAVDQALYRLVKVGRIRRLARGVFVKELGYMKDFSIFEIAKVKAESFGRRIVQQPCFVVPKSDPKFGKRPQTAIFFIDGRSSEFHIEGRKVQFKHIAARKLKLAETPVGEAARAVWNLGEKLGDGFAIMHATLNFNREDRVWFKRNIRWMPAWLSDQIDCSRWDKYHEILAAS
jgi:Transcriptional regulator, AbiEi antitoxin